MTSSGTTMHDDPRQRALRQFAALLDSLTELAATEQRGFLSVTSTVTDVTRPHGSREVWSRRHRVMPELQAWVCRYYRWLVAVLMFQMFVVVALVVALSG
jgi:hypothetical protein